MEAKIGKVFIGEAYIGEAFIGERGGRACCQKSPSRVVTDEKWASFCIDVTLNVETKACELLQDKS